MEAGARVWTFDEKSEETWLLCEVVKKEKEALTLAKLSAAGRPSSSHLTRSRKKGKVGEDESYNGVELANAPTSGVKGSDDNLMALVHLNEPALLHAVQERFMKNKIYTWTGPILISVNPFVYLDQFKGQALLEAHKRDGLLRSQKLFPEKELSPHIFTVADRAYRQMMNGKFKSQAILISGESGAGKTEATKIVLSYLTTLGTHNAPVEGVKEVGMMEKVMMSNPILEAFGNAKTLRNDNSSRFGKFIELGFSRPGALQGAKTDVYLLEKVRISSHSSGERNYHIFYQLLRGCSREQHKLYRFKDGATHGLELSNFFRFTGQGGAPRMSRGSDEKEFTLTLKAMADLGWSKDTVHRVLKLVAGILHLGQVKFEKGEDKGGEVAIVSTTDILQDVADLVGVDVNGLETALTESILVTRGVEINRKLKVKQAEDARDGVAKSIYSALFDWVVLQVNKSIGWEDESTVKFSTGVLDIFGFEDFTINSFEQLCINYTNETLQQQFNKFVFKLEQIEYEAENIDFSFITFPDNQDCLDLIQKNPTGILSILNDASRSNNPDKVFFQSLEREYCPAGPPPKEISDNGRFSINKRQRGRFCFSIHHFAGPVEYTLETGWVEKNKDEVPLAAKKIFATAISPLMREIFPPEDEKAASPKGRRSKTVGTQFKSQLVGLMKKVELTDPHYIRCLKPNDSAKPLNIVRRRMTEQLRCGGVLEAIRVARMGFPVKLGHKEFFLLYRLVLPDQPERVLTWNVNDFSSSQIQTACTKFIDLLLSSKNTQSQDRRETSRVIRILHSQNNPPALDFVSNDVQVGLSKIFLRKSAHDILEANRVFILSATATFLQSAVRCHQKRTQYLNYQDAAGYVQRIYRGYKGRERWWKLREDVAADLLTNNIRMLLVRNRYNIKWKGMRKFQIVYRVFVRKRNVGACKIQTFYRMNTKHSKYLKLKKAMISLQCVQRCIAAREVLFELRKAAKDIGNLKEDNVQLKTEMASLKAMLKAQSETKNLLKGDSEALRKKDEEISVLSKQLSKCEVELSNEREARDEIEKSFKEEKDLRIKLEKQVGNANSNPTPLLKKKVLQYSERIQNMAIITKIERELEQERQLRCDAEDEIDNMKQNQDRKFALERQESAKLRATIEEMKHIQNSLPRGTGVSLIAPGVSQTAAAVSQTAGLKMVHESGSDVSAKPVDAGQVLLSSEKKPEVDSIETRQDAKDIATVVGLPVSALDSTEILESLGNEHTTRSAHLPLVKEKSFIERSAIQILKSHKPVEVKTRSETEAQLRNSMYKFEEQMSSFTNNIARGLPVVLWEWDSGITSSDLEENKFIIMNSHVVMKMINHGGELSIMSEFTFSKKKVGNLRGKAHKYVTDPLSVPEILEVKAGCEGYISAQLPVSSSKTSSKGNKNSTLFLTIKTAPTLAEPSRFYFLKFKTRDDRNTMLNGLRNILAEIQVEEMIEEDPIQNFPQRRESFTPIQNLPQRRDSFTQRRESLAPKRGLAGRRESRVNALVAVPKPILLKEDTSKTSSQTVTMSDVKILIIKERAHYERLLFQHMQSKNDMLEMESEVMRLNQEIDSINSEENKQEKSEGKETKLVLQLSAKLETLLMALETMKETNEALNLRIIEAESEKTNRYM